MTSPTTDTSVSGTPAGGSSSSAPQLAPDTVPAAQQALATEHAAEWAYTFAAAFLGATPTVTEGATAHQARRDSMVRLIRDTGGTPVSAEPTYTPQKPITDATTAAVLLDTAESDCAQAWRAVLEHTDDPRLRSTALDALTGSAVRGTRWRIAAKQRPAAVAFPGRP